MNNMNPLYPILVADQQRKQLEEELTQLRLEKEAEQAHPANGWVAHRIAHLAEWMINTGESLSQRYDHAAMHDYNSHNGALAH